MCSIGDYCDDNDDDAVKGDCGCGFWIVVMFVIVAIVVMVAGVMLEKMVVKICDVAGSGDGGENDCSVGGAKVARLAVMMKMFDD